MSFTRSRARGRARAQLGSCSRSPGSSPLGAGGSAGPSCLACVARSLRRLAWRTRGQMARARSGSGPLQLLNVNVNGSHSSAKFWSQCRLLRWRSRRTVTNCIHFWFRAPRLNHRRQQSTCCCRLTHSISMLDRAACGLRVEGGRRSAGALLTRALQGISTRTRYLRRNLRSIYKRGGPQALAARLVRLP